MTTKQSRIDSLYGVMKKINSFCAAISGLILLFVSVSIFIDIILRYFFRKPTIWITEVSTYLFLYIIFFVTAYALQEDFHIKATFFYVFLSKKAKRIVNLVTSLFSIAFVFVMLWQTSRMTWKAIEGSWTSPTVLNVPFAYVYPAMVFGSFMLLITYVLKAIYEFVNHETEEN
ncbi:TRAP transporter small permease [Thermodesulfobacteriota bacterium]